MFDSSDGMGGAPREGAVEGRVVDAVGDLSVVAGLVSRLNEVVSDLVAVSLTGLSADELLGVVSGFEVVKRRLPVVDHRLVGEVDRRGVCHEVCEPSTKVLLAKLLRLDPGEAKARVDAARDVGPRMDGTGQVLPAVLAVLAAAQERGVVSAGHVRVIVHALDRLPAAVAAEHGDGVEVLLTAQAQVLAPNALAQVGRRVAEYLDPDGTLADDADLSRRREVTLTSRRDGSGYLSGTLTPACLAYWQAISDGLAAPRPVTGGVPDPRTAGQRMHDAFEDAALRLLRSGALPDSGGVAVTVLITATTEQLTRELRSTHSDATDPGTTNHGGAGHERDDGVDVGGDHSDGGDSGDAAGERGDAAGERGDYSDDDGDYSDDDGDAAGEGGDAAGERGDAAGERGDYSDDDGDADFAGTAFGRARTGRRRGSGSGFARTAHGGLISVAELVALADESVLVGVLTEFSGGVLAYGRTKRYPTPAQRCVLVARDGGCSFPDCSVPAGWCQAHHIVAFYAHGGIGKTDVDNLTLLCGYHHRMFLAAQWECLMIAGMPHWRPPAWLDPDRTPRRNTAHHPDIAFAHIDTPQHRPDPHLAAAGVAPAS